MRCNIYFVSMLNILREIKIASYENLENIRSQYSDKLQASNYPYCICSKYGFYIIISEGIIDLHHILFYLYTCDVADGLSW